jgi:hypothetical protein
MHFAKRQQEDEEDHSGRRRSTGGGRGDTMDHDVWAGVV